MEVITDQESKIVSRPAGQIDEAGATFVPQRTWNGRIPSLLFRELVIDFRLVPLELLRVEVTTKEDYKPAEDIDEAGDTLEPQREWNCDGYADCRDPKENAKPLKHKSN
ncbi:hypothetical protein ACLB2K_044376 [Fragaria x ananassa]